jgi:hypothetical protein
MAELTPYQMREAEVAAYKANIDTYTAIIESIDGTWDADLVQFQGMDPHTAAGQCSLDRIERLAELQLHDRMQYLVRTETIEWFKSKSILATMTK